MRIGVLVPFTNTTLEADLIKMCPNNASLHFTRMGGYAKCEVPGNKEMMSMGNADISEPLRLLGAVSPDVVLYGCTSATLVHGVEFDRKLSRSVSLATGAKTITAAGALIEALSILKVKKIGIASPYVASLNDLVINFLTEANFDVVKRTEPKKPLTSLEQGALSPNDVYELAVQANSIDTEALVLSCTDLKAHSVIIKLEGKTNKPVVTSNQAMMFSVAKIFGHINRENCPGMIFNYL